MAAFFAVEPAWLSNPKVTAIPVYARQLWLAGGLHAVANETDGRIAKRQLAVIAVAAGVSPKHAQALVDVGLWHDRGDCYEIHDFLKYNQSKAMREAQREKWRKAKARAAGLSDEDSEVESADVPRGNPAKIPRGIPRASLPCLALPTTKTLDVPPRNPPWNDDDGPPNPPIDEGRAEAAKVRAILAERGYGRPPAQEPE